MWINSTAPICRVQSKSVSYIYVYERYYIPFDMPLYFAEKASKFQIRSFFFIVNKNEKWPSGGNPKNWPSFHWSIHFNVIPTIKWNWNSKNPCMSDNYNVFKPSFFRNIYVIWLKTHNPNFSFMRFFFLDRFLPNPCVWYQLITSFIIYGF